MKSPPQTPVSREEYEAVLATNQQLQTQNSKLENHLTEQKQELDALRQEMERLQAMLRLSQHARFGRSSEKTTVSPDQVSFFNEVEVEAGSDSSEEEPTLETVTVRRPRRKGKRADDLRLLPLETVEHTLPESERHCPACDTVMEDCGATDHMELVYVPATLKSVNHRQHAYACPHCKEHSDKAKVMRAPIPSPLLPKSLASPSLVAHIVSEKFDKAVPLYRIERTFADKRFHLPRQSMARWLIRVYDEYLDGFRDALHEQLRKATHLHADETEVQVLKEPDRSPTQLSRMWVYRTGRGCPPILLYDYQETREGKHARNFLCDFTGTLQTDGYSGYNLLAGTVTRAGCLAHARRKFKDTERALPKGTRPEKRADLDLVLSDIADLYRIEKQTAERIAKEKLTDEPAASLLLDARQRHSRPIFDRLFDRLKTLEQEVLPKSIFGQAISYALTQEAALRVYLSDPYVDIDNNAAERMVRPFIVGRNNWIFSDTPAGARASACYYSLVETAKANGLDAHAYITWLLHELSGQYDPKQIDYRRFFPWSDQIPASCRIPVRPR